MKNSLLLKEIFASHKEELAASLSEYSLPKDSTKVEKIVSTTLVGLFESDGAYRQSLTQSEDYILQAAIQLLKTQQNLTVEISKATINAEIKKAENNSTKLNSDYTHALAAGLGALAGSALGTWGAICGAIAGTAIEVYVSSKRNTSKSPADPRLLVAKINTEVFVSIVEKICDSIDNLMETYRVQVERVESIYKQKETPTFAAQSSLLLDQVVKVVNKVQANPESVPPTILNAVEMMAESLENYDLKIENGKLVNLK